MTALDQLREALPTLSAGDLLDLLADCMNELDLRGADISFGNYEIDTQWGYITVTAGVYDVIYYTEACANAASEPVGEAA